MVAVCVCVWGGGGGRGLECYIIRNQKRPGLN